MTWWPKACMTILKELNNSFPSLRTIKLGVKTQMASPKTGFSIKI